MGTGLRLMTRSTQKIGRPDLAVMARTMKAEHDQRAEPRRLMQGAD